jgi:hypothetical protein
VRRQTRAEKRALVTVELIRDREAFLRLNPFLVLLVEAASKRGLGRLE